MADYNDYHGYVSGVFCLVGIVLNILNIIVWSRRRKTSLTIILTSLSMADLLVVFSYFLFAVDFFLLQTPVKHHHHSLTGMWIALISFHGYILSTTWSNWIVVTLAIFRYYKLSNEDFARVHCSKRRAIIAIVLICVVSFVVLFPNYFFYTVENIGPPPNHTNYWIVKTDFSKSAIGYQRFLLWFSGIVMGLLPCILLVGFTSSMIVAVSRIRNEHPMHFSTNRGRKTKMLIVILLTFLAAMLPIGLYAFVIAIDQSDKIEFFYFKKNLIVSDIFYLLTVLNSTSSFFVYLYFHKGFRDELRSLCPCRRHNEEYIPIDGDNEIPRHALHAAVQADPFFQ